MIVAYLLLGVVAAGILLLVFLRFRKKRFSAKEKEFFQVQWGRICDEVDLDPKRAVLEADALLDWAMKKTGYEGSLGEKMKKGASLFYDIDGLWRAHKLRNRIAHELNARIEFDEGHAAIRAFQRAFYDLHLL